MKKNILVITDWGYEEGLIQSYTLPYLRIIHKITPGSKIFLVTREKRGLEKEKLRSIRESLQADNIFLLAGKYHPAGFIKYLDFAATLIRDSWFILTNNIGYIHSFCTSAGSYAWLLSKITGRKLIIDSYEPHSEYMKDSGTWGENSFSYKLLRTLEKKQALGATHIIATTPGMLDFTKQRFNINLQNGFVKPACVDLDKFKYRETEGIAIRKQLNLENKIVGLYAGKFGDFYLRDEIFDLFETAFAYWKDKLHILLLSDLKKEELAGYCEKHDLDPAKFTLINSPHRMMPAYLSVADFGISPYKPAPSKKFCTPIKNGEYWAIGLPVIITRDISTDSDLIEQHDIGYVLKALSKEEYSKAVQKIDQLLNSNRQMLREKIRKLAVEKRSFSIAEKIYKEIYA
jgi:glycosyltransferase involved in cell wall biosynthesis